MENREQKPSPYHDEINLLQYFQVIWRWKILIIGICLIAVIATALISYNMPLIYRVKAAVLIGWITTGPDAKVTDIDSVENARALITDGVFNKKIIESLNLDPVFYYDMKFNTKLEKSAYIISILYDTQDPVQGKMIMEELLKNLLEYYKPRSDTHRESIDNLIKIMENQTVIAENKKIRIHNGKKNILSNMELLRKTIDLLKINENNLNNQRKGVEENSTAIVQDRNEMLKKGEKADSLALLLYSNTVQQNILYINNLNAELETNRLKQESAKNELSKAEIELKNKDTELKDIDTEIIDIQQKVKNLRIDKIKIEGLKIIQEPYSSVKPQKQRMMLNIAIAGLTSFFIGIFLAFFIEYFKKCKQETSRDV